MASHNALAINELWQPRWEIRPDDIIATAGSCFAQHIGLALRQRGFRWLNTEPAPTRLPETLRQKFGYDLFSFRTGNIYTARQLLQWLKWSIGGETPPDEIWQKDSRYFDPFRPSIEEGGFASESEARLSRNTLLRSLRLGLTQADIFVFTLGLTESWRNGPHGYEYHSCPGVFAGDFDKKTHIFHNQTQDEIVRDLGASLDLIEGLNPKLKVLFTVSPVPLTATASGQHVLVATSYSKSILRSAAGSIVEKREKCDYFPSYEIISSFPYRAIFFEPNLRTVSRAGVEHVMSCFFSKIKKPCISSETKVELEAYDPLCDEVALDKSAAI